MSGALSPVEGGRRPAAGRLRIVVSGYLGLMPGGGVAWDYVQYPLGFANLGHDVFYIEDTRQWPTYHGGGDGADCSANVRHLAEVMEAFGLRDRWAYRDEASGVWFGMTEARVRDICRTADVLVNVSCSIPPDDLYSQVPVRVLIDSDPMFTQVQYALGRNIYGEDAGSDGMGALVDAYTHHFTFGANVGMPDSRVPLCGVNWIPTRQPICLDRWVPSAIPLDRVAPYTTVMNWSATADLEFEGERWGQKNVEMLRMFPLPTRVPELTLAIAVGQTTGSPFPQSQAEALGWVVLDPALVAGDWKSYAYFIASSRGELSVAKETYVKARTGWFSCRSACYLAAGRPVVAQDTGWSGYLPTGQGLFAFVDIESAVDALHEIERDHATHARAARRLAEDHFDARIVLGELLAVACATPRFA